MIHFCQKLLIYAYKKYYRIENTLKLLKPFKFCLYVKQKSQGMHSPKVSLVMKKVATTSTSSYTHFPSSYNHGNSFYVFSVKPAFDEACNCENRALTRRSACPNVPVTQKKSFTNGSWEISLSFPQDGLNNVCVSVRPHDCCRPL